MCVTVILSEPLTGNGTPIPRSASLEGSGRFCFLMQSCSRSSSLCGVGDLYGEFFSLSVNDESLCPVKGAEIKLRMR